MKPARQLDCHPDELAPSVVRRILLQLNERIEANWPGVVDDLDPEHLHDLRVATRRTRTALGQLKGVLPEPVIAPFRPDFKWLASITGPCRDYDVWLDDLSQDLQLLRPESMQHSRAIEHAAREQRQRAWLTLKDDLLSPRFQELGPKWRIALCKPSNGAAKHGTKRVGEIARKRILRAHHRLIRRRPEVLRGASEEVLHQTRIDAKKLRYLLEFFSGLYCESSTLDLIRRLKDLQDDLGRFNDCAVQRRLLAHLSSCFESADQDSRGPVINAIHELTEHIEARQTRCRAPFREHYSVFSSQSTTLALTDLVRR